MIRGGGDEILAAGGNADVFLALLEKISDDKAWWSEAACLGADPELFFPESGNNSRNAQRICATCPVQKECARDGADELYGIWGGTSVEERRTIRREAKS